MKTNVHNYIVLVFSIILCLCTSCGNKENKDFTDNTVFTNPLFDGADPWVIKNDSIYYWCASANGGIEISCSRYLTKKEETRKVWSAPSTGWNSKNLWAPD